MASIAARDFRTAARAGPSSATLRPRRATSSSASSDKGRPTTTGSAMGQANYLDLPRGSTVSSRGSLDTTPFHAAAGGPRAPRSTPGKGRRRTRGLLAPGAGHRSRAAGTGGGGAHSPAAPRRGADPRRGPSKLSARRHGVGRAGVLAGQRAGLPGGHDGHQRLARPDLLRVALAAHHPHAAD